MALRELEFRERLLAHQRAFADLSRRLSDAPDALLPHARRLAASLEALAAVRPRRRIQAAAAGVAAADAHNLAALVDTLCRKLDAAVDITPRRPVHLVVVEADPARAEVARTALTAAHREIHVAADADTVTRLLDRRRCGLVVVGSDVPGLDGGDLVVRLRAAPRTADTPIVVAPRSGSTSALEYLALGADRCIDAPLAPGPLAEAANALLMTDRAGGGPSQLDSLTGVVNAEGCAEAFDRLAAFCRRSGNPLSLGMIELDGLREINDRRGDEAGDACLIHAASALRESLRQSDVVARWDGDAFVVLLPNTPLAGAVVAMQKFRTRIRDSAVRLASDVEVDLDVVAGVGEVEALERVGDAVDLVESVVDEARRRGAGTILSTVDTAARRTNVVLLVEDDPISAAVIRHRLTRDGFDVRHVADGEQALEASRTLDPTLVLLDVKLPGIDGFELLRRLRSDDRFDDTPVAIVSFLDDETNVVRGLELGADDYIAKPFSTAELRARIQRILQRRGIAPPAPPAEAGAVDAG